MKSDSNNSQKSVGIFYNVSALKPRTKLLVSILFGLISFVLSPFGFSTQIAEVTINIPWIILLPIMASLAFGWRYGFIAGITGAAFYPFLLWPEEGWLNVLTTFLYLVFFTSIGIVNGMEITHGFRRLWLKASIVFILFVGLLYLTFYNLINPLLSLNPPFWFKDTINYMDPSFLNAFVIKDSINVLLITIVADTMLCLPIIRRLFDLNISKTMRHNHRIFGAVIIYSILLWLIFVGLDFSLFNLHDGQQDGHILLALLVILSGGIIAARVLIYYIERQLSIKSELIDSQIKFKTVADYTYDWEYWDGTNGQLKYMSPSCERISGYAPQEFFLDRMLLRNIVFPDDSGLFDRHYADLHDANLIHDIVNFDFRITRKDGTIAHINHLCTPVFDELGNYIGRRISNRDVTERKLAEQALEESEEKYRGLVDNSPDAIAIYMDGKIVFVNNECLRLMAAKNKTELIGKPVIQLVHPDYREFVIERMKKSAIEGSILPLAEEKFLRLDGYEVVVEVKAMPILFEKKQAVQLIVRDISERKQAELALRESEKKFRNLIELAVDGILIGTNEGIILDANSKFCEMIGRNRNEIIGQHIQNIPFTRESIEKAPFRFDLLMEGKTVMNERVFIKPDGNSLIVEMRSKMMPDKTYQAIFTDITERKKAEMEIQKRDILLEASAKVSQILLSESDMDISIPKALEIIGKTTGQDRTYIFEYHKDLITGENLMSQRFDWVSTGISAEINNPELQNLSFDKLFPRWYKMLSSNIPISGSVKDFPDGERYILEPQGIISILVVPINIHGVFWGLVGFDNCSTHYNWSISERSILTATAALIGAALMHKREEHDLKISEERFKIVSESADEWVWEVNNEGLYTYSNHVVETILGYKPEEIIGIKYFFDFFDPEFKQVLKDKALDSFKDNKSFRDFTNTNIHKNGKKVIVKTTGNPILDDHGRLIGYRGVDIDITERVQMELALKESEEKYRLTFYTSPDSVNINKMDGTYVDVNYGFTNLTGYTKEDVIGKLSSEIEIWARPQDRDKLVKGLKEKGIVENLESVFRCKDGALKAGLMSARIIKINNTPHILSLTRNITERKILEDTLKKSEEQFRLLFERSSNAIFLIDKKNGKYLDANKAAEKLTGYSVSELKKMNTLGLTPKGAKERLARIANLKATINLGEIEYVHPDLPKRYATLSVVPLNENMVFGIANDITERKQFEAKLRILSRAIEQSPVSVVITDTEGNIEYVNPKFTKVTEYSFEEAFGENPRILKSGVTLENEYETLWKTIKEGKEWSGEFCNVKKNGQLYWESAVISPIINEKGTITHFVAVKEDITERKETDRKILSTIIETEEKERNRFSRDLHDGLGPLLSTIKLYFQWLAETDDLEKKKLITEKGDKNLNEAIESLREISNNLSPRALNTFGVEAAIKNFISNINQTQKLTVTFQSNAKERFDKNIEITIYRIVTELLNNTVKYADATKSKIELLIDEGNEWITLNYTDDGKGYDPIKVNGNSKGFGLVNITQRVNTLNGKINMISSIGNGIQVTIELPLGKK